MKKKFSMEQRQKIGNNLKQGKEHKREEKKAIINKIQEEAKQQLMPNLKQQMINTTNLIINLLKEKGGSLSNIQIMSIIARRSLLDVAVVGNISYTPQEMMVGFNLYLDMINKINEIKTFPPTVESFCAFMSISRTTYNNWLVDAEKRDVMDYIHSYLLGVLATGGLTGEVKEISAMYQQKVMGKVEATTPIVVEHKTTASIEDIQSRLNELKQSGVIEAEYEEKEV